MAINLKVLIPEATVNYILNPSPRFNINGWLASPNVAVSRSTDRSRFSVASVKVITPGQSLNEGVYYRVSALANISSNVTISVYVRGVDGKVRIRLIDNPRGQQWISDAFPLTDSRWNRIEISGQTTGSNDMRLYVESADSPSRAITFYVDGAQMELKPYSTSYCDGNQPGCQWNIQAYNSQASRDATTRLGGKWVGIAGPCRPDNDIYVTLLDGLGMPPIRNNIQEWSNADGAFYQNSKVMERIISLTFWIKNKQTIINRDPDLTPLHELRQELIDVIKPYKTTGNEPFLLQYQDEGGDRPLFLWARYDSGLESSWDVRNEFSNSFPLRLLAVDPMWWEDTMDVFPMSIIRDVSSDWNSGNYARIFSFKVNGIWKFPLVDSSGYVAQSGTVVAIDPSSGKVFWGGTSLYRSKNNGGVKLGPYATVMSWDGTNYSVPGTGADDLIGMTVGCLSFSPDGKMYAGGTFTKIGNDVLANNIAVYNPATDSWSALGTGLNNTCRGVCVADNGQVYAVGDFTAAGGVTCYYVARWDGSQWRTVGATSGLSDVAYAIAKGIDGTTLYIGGNFATDHGVLVTYNKVCKINTTTNLLSPMGTGVTESYPSGVKVFALAVSKDGTVYIAKQPAGQNLITTQMGLISKWNGGNSWLPVGVGLQNLATPTNQGRLTAVAVLSNGNICVAGYFDYSGTTHFIQGSGSGGFAIFNGSVWVPMEISTGGGAVPYGVAEGINKEIYIVLPGKNIPATTSVFNNGTSPTYPKIYYTGSGLVQYISNAKTGESVYLNLQVYANEEIFFDFAKGTINSSTRGPLQYAIMPGSELRAMYALPGENIYTVYVLNDVNGYMQAQIVPQHYSADAVVNAVPLS